MKRTVKLIVAFVTALSVGVGTPLLGLSQSVHAVSSCSTSVDLMSTLTPYSSNYNDSSAINAGVKFIAHGAPTITGVKFYKGVDNTGTHVAHLYDVTTSTELASATYSSETSSGWQTVSFGSAVPISDSHDYMVWVSMPNGHYAVDGGSANGPNDFETVGNGGHGPWGGDQTPGDGPEALEITAGDNNGVYSYTSDHTAAPSNGTNNNYWVSPTFVDTTNPGANTGLAVSDATAGPSLTWSGQGHDTNSATSSGAIRSTIIQRISGESSDWTIGYQDGDQTSWADGPNDPTALPGTGYIYNVKNVDYCGNVSTGSAVTVTTASRSLSHVFSTNPASVDTGQTDALTVGMHWQTSTAGNVWGVRYHRGSQPSPFINGRFRVGLWDNDGTLLASREVPQGNMQWGWVDVRFNAPVSVSANHDYVVGYFSPIGAESYTNNSFTSAVTNGVLSARADGSGTPNGVYTESSSMEFPSTASPNANWYGVDVNFYIP